MQRRRLHWGRGVVGAVALGLWAWYTSGRATFTLGAELLIGVAIVVLVVRVAHHSTETAAPRRESGWVLPWVLWGALVVAFELFELFHLPRPAYPTLSYLANKGILRSRVVRALAEVTWVVLGWMIVP